MIMLKHPVLPALLAALLLGACASTPWSPPATELPLDWRAPMALEGEAVAPVWWNAFDDPVLHELIAAAEFGNLDLAALEFRVLQARAGLDSARGALLPQVAASGSASRTEGDSSWRAQGALRASYTLDLWGADRARLDASLAQLDAVIASRSLSAWRLGTAVAQLHFNRRALEERVALAGDSLDLAERTFELIRARYDAGLISGLDLALAESAVASERGNLLAVHQARDLALNSMALLLGLPPVHVAETLAGGDSLLDLAVPMRPSVIPAQALVNRPDIRIQEASLRAANADIGIARAQLLPQVSLSAGTAIARGGGGWIADIGASLAQVVFDGGQRRAGITISEARYEELLRNYQATILDALVEVEDALVLTDRLESRESIDHEQLDAAERAFRLSEARYRAGLVDALTLLSAQNSFLRARDSLLQTRAARLQAMAGLYAAIAGRSDEAASTP
jgi:multidrug efflux system outer membrane protein